jgi:uncharacterized protein YwgA
MKKNLCITLVIIQFHSKMHGPYSINFADKYFPAVSLVNNGLKQEDPPLRRRQANFALECTTRIDQEFGSKTEVELHR